MKGNEIDCRGLDMRDARIEKLVKLQQIHITLAYCMENGKFYIFMCIIVAATIIYLSKICFTLRRLLL